MFDEIMSYVKNDEEMKSYLTILKKNADKQIAIAPVFGLACPTCMKTVADNKLNTPKYCPNCGQHLLVPTAQIPVDNWD